MKMHLQSKTYRKIVAYEALSALYMTGFMSLFVLYLTESQGYESVAAFSLLGVLGAIRYSLPIITGKVIDRYLSTDVAIILGAILQFFGMGLIFISSDLLILGLGLVAMGYSFLKPNITVALGKLFDKKSDRERDSGFALFYSLGNLGGFIAPLIYGSVGSLYGWDYGFLLSAICLVFLLWVLFIPSKKNAPIIHSIKKLLSLRFISIFFLILGSTVFLLYYNFLSQYIMYGAAILLAVFLWDALRKANPQMRQNYLQIFLIVFLTIIFFAFCEQQFFFLPLFIDNYVDANILGFHVPTPWFNAINPLVVIIAGTFLSKHWLRDDVNKKTHAFFSKFYPAFSFLSLSFFIIAYGISINQQSLPSFYIIISYIFCTLGEVILVPASLSLITKLSDQTQKSFFIGIFYLTMAFAQPLAGYLSSFVTIEDKTHKIIPPDYTFSFFAMGSTIILVMVLVFIVRKLKNTIKN